MSADAVNIASQLIQERLPHLVYLPGSDEYQKDMEHFLAGVGLPSICSVRPSTITEVGEILKIVGRDDIRCPFAVRGGGHGTAAGFSSTTGIQISMAKFTEITYDENSQTVTMGAGLTWDKVYKELEKYGVTVAGGRVWGVGTGLLLGGGYSWVTEEHGLSVDTMVSYDLVKPNGTFVKVTETTEPDLFWALKGGMNNFGVVTSFTLKAFPMRTIWGGVITYSMEHNQEVVEALADFSANNTDDKTGMMASYVCLGPEPIWQLVLFYNGETEPATFKKFLEIPSTTRDIGPRTMHNLLEISQIPGAPQGFTNIVPVRTYTPSLIKKMQSVYNEFHAKATNDGRSIIGAVFIVEPFKFGFSKATPSAFPHSAPLSPSLVWTCFSSADDQEYFHDATWKLTKDIQEAGIEEGQCKADDLFYPNYAIGDAPLERLYGENLPRLREIREKVDPKNVMRLTGGFKL